MSHSQVILAFESSTNYISAAVYANNAIVAMQTVESRFGQATELVSLAVAALTEVGIDFTELTHVAAGCGPGSFTGIRVALAAAKGICLAHDLPGLGVSGIGAVAFAHIQDANGWPILCLADTRRGNVYAQVFNTNMTQQGKIFEAQIDQLPFLVPASICIDGLILLGHRRFEAAEMFVARGITAKPVTSYCSGLGDDYGTFLVDAGMIAKLAAQQIVRDILSPLTPLYLADARLGPKKKKLVK